MRRNRAPEPTCSAAPQNEPFLAFFRPAVHAWNRLTSGQGQEEVTPESLQLPAVQQTPAEQEFLPVQRASQLVPPQRTFAGHALDPVQLTVLLPPSSVTPAGHEDTPEHVTLQAVAEHVTSALHELEPQVTAQLDPPHAT